MATVKKNIIPPVPPAPTITYTVELSEAEAQALYTLLYGGVISYDLKKVGLDALSGALEDAGVKETQHTWVIAASLHGKR